MLLRVRMYLNDFPQSILYITCQCSGYFIWQVQDPNRFCYILKDEETDRRQLNEGVVLGRLGLTYLDTVVLPDSS